MWPGGPVEFGRRQALYVLPKPLENRAEYGQDIVAKPVECAPGVYVGLFNRF